MQDARLQPWAYVTDGDGLFEATGKKRVTGATARRVEWELENCRMPDTFVYVPENALLSRFELVRAAPLVELVQSGILPIYPDGVSG